VSDKNNSLEQYLLEQMSKIDPTARKSRGSGSTGLDIADLVCKDWYIESKQKHTKANITVDREKEILKLKDSIPVDTQKECLWAYENKYGEKYILLEADTFFRLLNKQGE